MRRAVSFPNRLPQSSCPLASAIKALGVVLYRCQYSSSAGRILPMSNGKGGSQALMLLASVTPGYVRRKGSVNIGGVRKNAGKAEPGGSGFQFSFLLPQIVIDFYGLSFGNSEVSLGPFGKPDRFIRICRRSRRRCALNFPERSEARPCRYLRQ